MSLSTLKGEELAQYLPEFIENRDAFKSVEHYLEEQYPVCLSDQWIYRYYTQQWAVQEEMWPGPPYPPFFHWIARWFRTDVQNVVNNITLVMTLGTLDKLLSSDPDGPKAAFDNMHEQFDVRCTSITSLMPISEISSFDWWKDEHILPGYTYRMDAKWKPMYTYFRLRPEPDASGLVKPVILVARSDLPCTKLEICQAFETMAIRHWLKRLLPIIYNETDFDLDVQVTESWPELSIVVWLRVMCRHCDPTIFKELLSEAISEPMEQLSIDRKRKRKSKAVQHVLASVGTEFICCSTAAVPAERSPSPAVRAPTPMPSPRRMALLLEADRTEEEEEEEENGGRISLGMAFFWDIVAVAFAIFIGFAASNGGASCLGA